MNLQFSKKNSILALVTLVIGFITGLLCHTNNATKITTITRVDTMVIEKPVPYKVEVLRKVSVPIYVPTPSDTVVNYRVDTVRMQVPVNIESREYRDSTYRAVVTGPVIGDYSPTLDEIEIYNRKETIITKPTVSIIRPMVSVGGGKNSFSIGGGVTILQKIDLEAKYLRIDNKDHFMIEGGWHF